MRFSPKTWSLLSVLLFVAAILFWLKGNEYEARRRKAKQSQSLTTTNAPRPVSQFTPVSTPANNAALAQLSTARTNADDFADSLHPYRLRNTRKSLNELTRDDHAILLANALIDT